MRLCSVAALIGYFVGTECWVSGRSVGLGDTALLIQTWPLRVLPHRGLSHQLIGEIIKLNSAVVNAS